MSDRLLAVLLALFLVLPLGLSLDGELFGPDDAVSPGAELESLLAEPQTRPIIVTAPQRPPDDSANGAQITISVEEAETLGPWRAYPIDATGLRAAKR